MKTKTNFWPRNWLNIDDVSFSVMNWVQFKFMNFSQKLSMVSNSGDKTLFMFVISFFPIKESRESSTWLSSSEIFFKSCVLFQISIEHSQYDFAFKIDRLSNQKLLVFPILTLPKTFYITFENSSRFQLGSYKQNTFFGFLSLCSCMLFWN